MRIFSLSTAQGFKVTNNLQVHIFYYSWIIDGSHVLVKNDSKPFELHLMTPKRFANALSRFEKWYRLIWKPTK